MSRLKRQREQTNPAIVMSYTSGGGSGMYEVAKIIARVFPAYKAFAIGVVQELAPAHRFIFGPYPKDALIYKGKKAVEYMTPPQTDGLGTTNSSLKKNGSRIEGVAMLTGQTPDLLLLSVRLSPELSGLTSIIVHQVERDAERDRK